MSMYIRMETKGPVCPPYKICHGSSGDAQGLGATASDWDTRHFRGRQSVRNVLVPVELGNTTHCEWAWSAVPPANNNDIMLLKRDVGHSHRPLCFGRHGTPVGPLEAVLGAPGSEHLGAAVCRSPQALGTGPLACGAPAGSMASALSAPKGAFLQLVLAHK